MTALDSFSFATLAWITFVMLVAGFAHGVIGFGFPVIATPLLTLALPLKQAIVVSVVPTLVMTALNAFHGGKLRESIGRYWYLPLCLMVGSYAGTRLLIVTPNEPFVLLLALILIVYLNMERLGKTNVPAVQRHPHMAAVGFGLLAGVFESTANVAGPALLVYFMLIGINPRAMIQALNFSFVAGKSTQIATWSAVGGVTLGAWAQTLPWACVAFITLIFGRRVHARISTVTYMRWLRVFLWMMVLLLLVQFTRSMLVRGAA